MGQVLDEVRGLDLIHKVASQIKTRLTQFLSFAQDRADEELFANQVIEGDSLCRDVSPGIESRDRQSGLSIKFLDCFGLDQRQLPLGSPTLLTEVAVANDAFAGHEFDLLAMCSLATLCIGDMDLDDYSHDVALFKIERPLGAPGFEERPIRSLSRRLLLSNAVDSTTSRCDVADINLDDLSLRERA